MEYPEIRELDGVYFRVKRNGKWENICFSDMTDDEMDDILKDKKEDWLKAMCKILGNVIHEIGDQFQIGVSLDDEVDE